MKVLKFHGIQPIYKSQKVEQINFSPLVALKRFIYYWPEINRKSMSHPKKGISYQNQKQEMRVFEKKNNLFIIYCFWKWLETNDRIKLNLGPDILDVLDVLETSWSHYIWNLPNKDNILDDFASKNNSPLT